MRNVLLSSNSILVNPPPGVSLKSLDGKAIEMELSFRVPDIAFARDEIFDLVYRHAKATRLNFVHASGGATAPPGAKSLQRTMPLRLLDALPLFAALTEDEKEALAGKMTRRTYQKDDIVLAQGMTLATLMIVRNGVLVATHREGPSAIKLRAPNKTVFAALSAAWRSPWLRMISGR